jgi:radical SAM protein with 4Fe4S-binding SPASM domain
MDSQYPLKEISVEITWQCLQNCEHCSSGASSSARDFLSKEEIMKIAADFKSLEGQKIELSGGEPFLHQDIAYLLNSLKRLSLEVHVFTSGTISKEPEWESAMKKTVNMVKDAKVDKVVFSLHGANASTHDAIVKTPGSFGHAVAFIRELVKEKVAVGIHFVPMTPNFEELHDLVEFAISLGVQDLSVLRFVPQGRGEKNKEELILSKEEVAQLVEFLAEEKAKRKFVKVGSHLDFRFLIDESTPKRCTAGIEKCLVEANGNIIPCAVFKGMTDDKENFVAGNVNEKCLSHVWETSQVFKMFRDFDPKKLKGCNLCGYLSNCRGRCPAQRIYDHGDFYMGPDNYCPKEIFTNNKKSLGSEIL